ncbi:MAG TPA: PKD domain-containing protein, partial [Flavobacteriales bacterium]|nr:PKD domain-containing protein [Flavobacteriales bacterium]
GETEQRIYLLPAWREAPCYTERERAALAWAEALTVLGPHGVPDEVYDRAIAQFSAPSGTLVVNTPVQFTNTSVLADNYLWDFGDGTTSTESDPAHTYTMPGTYNVSLTATGGECSYTTTMEVTVEIGTAVTAAGAHRELAVWATPDHLIVLHPFGIAPVDVDVYDATGRLVLGRSAITKPERITLDGRSLNTGVWFVRVTSGDVQRTFRVPLVR